MTAPRPERREDVRVEQHLGLAHVIARRYRLASTAASLDLDDLVQEAALGMLRARETFDPELASWSTYAGLWMKQTINRYIQNNGAGVRVPVHLQEKRRKAGEPVRASVHSLDAAIGGGDGEDERTYLSMLAAPEPEPAPDLPPLETLIARTPDLSDREIRVLRMRASDAELTLQQIGAELGISRERVRQIEAKAMLRIREQLAGDGELEGVEVPRYVATQRSQSPQRRQHWSQAAAQRRRERMQDPAYREAMNQRRRATRAERKAQQQPGRAAA